jgi:hypothetical protein
MEFELVRVFSDFSGQVLFIGWAFTKTLPLKTLNEKL